MSQSNEAGAIEAPPIYERHQLDQLYDDIDPYQFLSGANTPFNAMSRNPSRENLRSLMDTATLDNTAANTQLQSRLASLQESETRRGDSSIDEEFAHPSPRISSFDNLNSLAPISRATSQRGSYHQYLTTPPNAPNAPSYFPSAANAYDMEALARIPSYNTAVRTPMVTPPGTRNGLPTYEVAVSVSTSPVQTPLRAPPTAHMAHHRTGSESSSNGSIRAMRLSPPQTTRPHSVHVRSS